MDKQKQIEEMAKTLCANCRKTGYSCSLYSTDDDWVCVQERERAEFFFNAGYRKIPENAVVLTSEEYVDLFNSKASGFMTSAIGDIPLNIDGMRKLVDEVSRLLIVQGELQDLNAKYYNEVKDLRRKLNNDGAIYSRLEVGGFIDKARKETAEKFAAQMPEKVTEFLEEKLKDGDFVNGKTALIEFTVAIVKHIADEIAKEFTEGKV